MDIFVNNIFINELHNYKNEIDKVIEGEFLYKILSKNNNFPFMNKYLSAFQRFSIGGKRIRAYLVKLGYEMCAGYYDKKIIYPSLSYEIFQSGILIHDDIIDKSDTRRNLPTMHVALGNDHLAISKSICMGDIGLFIAIDIIANSDFSDAIVNNAIKHQIKVFEITVLGELKDIELSVSNNYTLEDIIEMYKLKTSWYTIIGPLQLGAILSNASDKLLLQIEEIGELMGIAFQIKDDILGIFGSKKIIGKSNLSDMQEGKKTVLTSHFITKATNNQINEFRKIYGNKSSLEEELYTIQQLFYETKTYEYANSFCKEYANKSIDIINSMDIDAQYKSILLDLLNYLCIREL